jgi:hypothetical protein
VLSGCARWRRSWGPRRDAQRSLLVSEGFVPQQRRLNVRGPARRRHRRAVSPIATTSRLRFDPRWTTDDADGGTAILSRLVKETGGHTEPGADLAAT